MLTPDILTAELDSYKAQNIVHLEVAHKTTVTSHLIIASGTSSRQVASMAERIIEYAKSNGERPLGIEGLDNPDWVLVDLGHTLIHLMQEATREYYQLEALWTERPDTPDA